MTASAAASSIMTVLAVLASLQLPQRCFSETKRKSWYIPTRLTAHIPCLDKDHLAAGRSIDQEHSGASLYRWVQSDGNIVGSGFYKHVRLLKMPTNHSKPFFSVQLECMLFNWAADSIMTLAHELNFYEAPTITAAVTLGFRNRKNYTEFVDYLGRVNYAKDWCMQNVLCIQALVAPVRSPELEYPRQFDLAAAFNRTPLTDLQKDLRKADVTGEAPKVLYHVNFVLRLSQSNRLEDLCDPLQAPCAKQLLEGRHSAVLQFSEAAIRTLDRFAQEKSTVRKLMTKKLELVETQADALNYSLKLYSVSLCPLGYYGPSQFNATPSDKHDHNGTTLLCMACPPGTMGSNGLDCFAVSNNFYTEGWGTTELTPCPDYFVTTVAGATSKDNCTLNSTTPELIIMEAMRHAWKEIEMVMYGSLPGLPAVLLLLYLFVSAYALFWQLHRLVTLMQYKHRRGMSDRLLKRFIAEAYLRDLRRLQYWKIALAEAKVKLNKS